MCGMAGGSRYARSPAVKEWHGGIGIVYRLIVLLRARVLGNASSL